MERLPGWSLAVALLCAAACGGTGQDVNQLDTASQSAEGGHVAVTNPPPTQYTDPFAGAPPYAGGQQGGDNSHNPGQACGGTGGRGCHGGLGAQSEAPAFLIGGTVYQDYYGMVPAQGVEVRIVDAAGHAASTYSDRGGNFYIRASSSNGVTFPATVGARNGTITRPMITTLTSTMWSCGQTSCHERGGPDAGAYYPIHVP